jgi:hypothetical protein
LRTAQHDDWSVFTAFSEDSLPFTDGFFDAKVFFVEVRVWALDGSATEIATFQQIGGLCCWCLTQKAIQVKTCRQYHGSPTVVNHWPHDIDVSTSHFSTTETGLLILPRLGLILSSACVLVSFDNTS